MEMTDNNLCNSCTNAECEFQSGIVRTKCAFYMPPCIEPDNCGNYVIMQPTTFEVISKADYENRLKADMVAILEETQAQIDDLWEATWHSDYRGGFKDGCIESNNIIQQKINSLKEVKDGENNN